MRLLLAALALGLAGDALATDVAESEGTTPALVEVPADPLAGCVGTISPTMLTFFCSTRAVVMVLPANGDPLEVMHLGMATLRVERAQVVEMEVEGREPIQAMLSTSARSEPVLATVIQRRQDVFDYVGCTGDRATCERVLVGLSLHGFPDLEPHLQVWRPPQLADGRTLAVPRGCVPVQPMPSTLPGFACGLDSLQAQVVATDETPEAMLDETLATRRSAAKANGTKMRFERMNCTVGGAPGACAATTRPPHDAQDPPHSLVGYAQRPDGRVQIAVCAWRGTLGSPPGFCEQMFQVVAGSGSKKRR